MAKLPQNVIRNLGRSIVAGYPGGIRRKALMNRIFQTHPNLSMKEIEHAVWDLDKRFPKDIANPSRGIFQPISATSEENGVVGKTEQVIIQSGTKVTEADFYNPFADWLQSDLDEVNSAVPLGGSGLKSKWGTPDVVGVYKPLAGHLIKFHPEIVSVEIKTDPQAQAPIVAFGQAVAYRLFSTKTYIAMPTTLSDADQSRLEALCMLFGVGLVLFDLNKEAPNFAIRMRAQRFTPDMFYVNEFADRLKTHDKKLFEALF
jgi:hypothetical protein